jgi:hypothetical protein
MVQPCWIKVSVKASVELAVIRIPSGNPEGTNKRRAKWRVVVKEWTT